MRIVDIHKARRHLIRLVDQASKGDAFVITKAGKPVVKVIPISSQNGTKVRRLGFLEGHFSVPDDFDRMGSDEIRATFDSK